MVRPPTTATVRSCAGVAWPRHWSHAVVHGRGPAIDIIGFLVAGLIIGALARLVKSGSQNLSVVATLGLGVVGSLIGGFVASLIGTGDIWELNVLGFVVAVVAAVLLIGVAETTMGRR